MQHPRPSSLLCSSRTNYCSRLAANNKASLFPRISTRDIIAPPPCAPLTNASDFRPGDGELSAQRKAKSDGILYCIPP